MNKALAEVIEYYKKIVNHRLFAILDTEYKIILADENVPTITNMGTGVIGKHFINDFERTPKRKEFTIKNITRCVENRELVMFLSVNHTRIPGYETLIYSYAPLIDKKSNEVIGILVEAQVPKIPINYYALKKHLFDDDILPKQKRIKNKLNLTSREQEILFLLFHCDTNEEIAAILSGVYQTSITVAAIRKSIWRGLYTKFDVQNILALKNAAIQAQMHDKVPPSLNNDIIFKI